MNTITNLGEIKYISSYTSKSIQSLHEYMEINTDNQLHKKKMIVQINLLIRSLNFLTDKINYITSLQDMTKLSNWAARKGTAYNLDLRREKTEPQTIKTYLSVKDNILANMVVDRKPLTTLEDREDVRWNRINRNIPSGGLNIIPANGSDYCLREVFLYLKEDKISLHKFYQLATYKILHPKHLKVLRSRSTFCRNHNKYLTTSILSREDNEDIAMVRP